MASEEMHLPVKCDRVARWPFFGPFLANVAIFESHFLEKKLFGYKLNFGYFVAIFENFFL
jgi:hypothetical protein